MLTREQQREQNRREWRERAARQDAEARRHQEERRAEKAARRERNRGAWWRMRYGVMAPGQEAGADDLPEVPARSVERVAPDEWHVTGRDMRGYMVERVHRVTLPDGSSYDLPSAKDAAELIAIAVDTCRSSQGFAAGQELDGYTVEHVTRSAVKVRHRSGKAWNLTPRYDEDGAAYVVVHAGTRAAKTLRAEDMRPAA